jgi:hypothetical protein
MENYGIDVLTKELDNLNIYKEGFENEIKKRSGNDLKFVVEQLFIVYNQISEIEKLKKCYESNLG